jgi:ubiquinone biosynthesis protein
LMKMFNKTKRYIKIVQVFVKYKIYNIILNESKIKHGTVDLCSCPIDSQRRLYSVQLRTAFEELGPSFIKLGQAMSRRPDIIPAEYGRELEKLQESVHAYDFKRMQETLNLFCNTKVENNGIHSDYISLFDEFNKEPIASASIAQVYEAILNGKKVVVKIARPGMMAVINLDLDILYDLKFFFLKLLRIKIQIDIDGFLEEFKSMLNRELDYRNEALNMERFRNNFKKSDEVHIPKVCWELSNNNILVMEQIKGIPVWDYKGLSISEKKRLAKLISSSFLKMVYIDGFFHADPHPSNIFVKKDGSIAYLDFGAVGKLDDVIKKEMYSVFYAVYIKNVDLAARSFLRLANKCPEDIDIHAFKWDIDELISRYHYSKGEYHSDDFVKLALKYDLALPATFSLLERALVLIESTCLDLDAEFNLIDEIKGLSKEISRLKFSPFKMIEDIQMELDSYYDLIRNMPTGINDIFEAVRMMRSSNITKQKNIEKNRRLVQTIFHSMFLIILLVASTALLAWGERILETIGLAGFAVSVVLGAIMILRRP